MIALEALRRNGLWINSRGSWAFFSIEETNQRKDRFYHNLKKLIPHLS